MSLQDAFEQNPLLFYGIFGLVVLSALGAILFTAYKILRSFAQRNAGRYICKIRCQLLVEDLVINGRIVRVGPNSCQFVPDVKAMSDRVAGILLRSDIPDFDLCIGNSVVPVVPDVPGLRFTSIFFVKPADKDTINGWIERSETKARRENTPPNIKASKQRDALKSLRLSRLKTQAVYG